jgi:hypothetical protein
MEPRRSLDLRGSIFIPPFSNLENEMLDINYIMKTGRLRDIIESLTPTILSMTRSPATIKVKLGGMKPGETTLPIGTRLTPVPDVIRNMAFTTNKLIWAKEDNNGSIIIIDQDTVEIDGEQHKLVHPIKLNHQHLYCIWINGNPAKP